MIATQDESKNAREREKIVTHHHRREKKRKKEEKKKIFISFHSIAVFLCFFTVRHSVIVKQIWNFMKEML